MGLRGRSLPKTPSKTLAYGSFGRTKRRCVDTHPAEVAAIASEPSTSTHARTRTHALRLQRMHTCGTTPISQARPQDVKSRALFHVFIIKCEEVDDYRHPGRSVPTPYRGQTDHAWPSCLARSLVQAARAAHPSKMGRDDATDAGGLLGRPTIHPHNPKPPLRAPSSSACLHTPHCLRPLSLRTHTCTRARTHARTHDTMRSFARPPSECFMRTYSQAHTCLGPAAAAGQSESIHPPRGTGGLWFAQVLYIPLGTKRPSGILQTSTERRYVRTLRQLVVTVEPANAPDR